jgi:hypothetical protein
MTKKKNKLPRRWPSRYPLVIFKGPTGTLYPECMFCHGTGRKWLKFSDSDSPDAAAMHQTKHKCGHCKGLGYDLNGRVIVKEVP